MGGQGIIRRWKSRSVFTDASHTACRLQTTLTPAQEAIVVQLRKMLLLPLDDLLSVCREFICADVSRSGLDRYQHRHGVGNLKALLPAAPKAPIKGLKAYEPGHVHVDVKRLPQRQDQSSRSYLFVAIDRAARWVFVQIKGNKSAASARAFLKALHKACPIRINKALTDNGKAFSDRLFASRAKAPSGRHKFDRLCHVGIEHRLTKPETPQSNGMAERFNGRIPDVLKTHRFDSGKDMCRTIERYEYLYNHQLPQSALHSRTPMQELKRWYNEKPGPFQRQPRVPNYLGCGT